MKKTSGKTIVLIGIVFLLIVSIASVLFLGNSDSKKTPTNTPEPNSDEVSKQEKTVQIDLVEYEVYDLEKIDFRFVIAKVRVKTSEETKISLEHFTTSEKIVLNDIDDYVSKLERNNLYLGKQNVWFELVSSEENYLAKLFIPVVDDELNKVELFCDLEGVEVMNFDLTCPTGTLEQLGYVADDVISDGKSYEMTVSEAMMISDDFTRTYEDGFSESYLLPSTAEIHAFHVEAVSLWGDAIEIEEAWYLCDDELFEGLNGQFTTKKYDNIVNMEITDAQSGYIFFVTLNPEDAPIEYHGTLQLKLKGVENMIHIQVDLQ